MTELLPLTSRRAPHDDAGGTQAAGPRATGGACGHRGVHRDRPAGPVGLEPSGVAVGAQSTTPTPRLRIAEHYRQVFDSYQPRSSGYAEGDTRAERRAAVTSSSIHLRDHLHEVPVLMVVYQEGRIEELPLGSHPGFWGSVVPAIWSFMLALRARGLGSTWTTMTCRREPEVAEVLGVHHEDYTQIGLFPVAYTIGTDFKPAPGSTRRA